jgi:hypothetical protein
MRKNILIALVAVASAGLVGGATLSCSSVKCGSLTHNEKGACVADQPLVCAGPLVASGGQCVLPDGGKALCGVNTVWDADSGQCEGIGGGTQEDGGAGGDGGVQLPTVGMRWTGFLLNKPDAITTVANLQLPSYIQHGNIVIIMASAGAPGSADYAVYGGSGTKTIDSPLTYSFQSAFGYGQTRPLPLLPPVAVPATANGDTDSTLSEAGYLTSPQNGNKFDWAFLFLPLQPVLDVRDVTIKFSAGGDGLIKSDMSGGNYGNYTGCFTRASADALYISPLTTYLGQLLDANGAVPDCDPEGGSNLTGYIIDATWEADEEVQLDWGAPPIPDGGTPPNDAAVSD